MFDFGPYTQVSDSGPHGPLVWKYGLYEILYSVLMVTRMVLFGDFISFGPPPHCIQLPQTQAIGQVPEINWALNNPGFHPVSSEPPLSNIVYIGMYYRMAKMERILPTFTLLSHHLKGL